MTDFVHICLRLAEKSEAHIDDFTRGLNEVKQHVLPYVHTCINSLLLALTMKCLIRPTHNSFSLLSVALPSLLPVAIQDRR